MRYKENIVEYHGIGAVKHVRNKRSRNLSIRINLRGEVKITRPPYVSLRQAEAFLMLKKQWVMARLADIDNGNAAGRLPEYGQVVSIRGQQVHLVQKRKDESAEDALWKILLDQAKAYLPGRVAELAERHSYHYTGLKIRKMKSRWGSCTAKNSLNLNSWLMMLPDHLSDYVILHELVHTRYRDHSSSFWKEVDRVTGGSSKSLRKALRKVRIMHIPPDG